MDATPGTVNIARDDRWPRCRFASAYEERRGEPIGLRLPQSLDKKLREVAGWESKEDNPKLKTVVEQALSFYLDPIAEDAIRTAVALKRDAIARERKRKGADQSLIAAWESEVERLEALL